MGRGLSLSGGLPQFFFQNRRECDILAAVQTLSTGGFIHMKNLVMFLGAVLLVGAAACSSSSNAASQAAAGNCPSVGSTACSADTPETQADVDSCNKSLNDPTCGSKYKDLLVCAGQNAKCGSDNKTDSSGILSACGSQVSAYSACTTPATGDGGA
jgi:hypothetical protein